METIRSRAETLKTPLPTDSARAEEIMQAAAEAEALGYVVADEMRSTSMRIADVDKTLTIKRMQSLSENSKEKVAIAEAKADADTAEYLHQKALLDADFKYLKHIGSLIEKRTSLAQSILSNITAQVKAGINLYE